jgi:uncharacterized Zn finger protein (UPF0148 family)
MEKFTVSCAGPSCINEKGIAAHDLEGKTEMEIVCSGCGQVLSAGPDNEVECFWCGKKNRAGAAPTAQVKATPSDPVLSLDDEPPSTAIHDKNRRAPSREQFELAADDDEEYDGKPYGLEGKEDRPCPHCGLMLPVDAKLCPSCGFDKKKGARVARRFEPIQRVWEAGWPTAKRRQLFIIGQCVVLPLGIIGSIAIGEYFAFVGPWLFFTLMTVFLLGTYDRVQLTRSERGKVVLKHGWTVCFITRPLETLALGDYEGVMSGRRYDVNFVDWGVAVMLIGCGVSLAMTMGNIFVKALFVFAGIMGGICWWYFMIRRDSCYVALKKDDGYPAKILYRGWSEDHMRDLAAAIKTAGFPGT